jgi:hypothetical protein
MSEHFLLSRLARDLPVTKVIRMSEDAAYNWFCHEKLVAFAPEYHSCE